MATITLPVSEVKSKFCHIVEDVEKTFERCIVTRKGKPAVVILSIAEFRSLLETVAVMADKKLLKKIKQAKKDIEEGRVYSYEEVFGEPLDV